MDSPKTTDVPHSLSISCPTSATFLLRASLSPPGSQLNRAQDKKPILRLLPCVTHSCKQKLLPINSVRAHRFQCSHLYPVVTQVLVSSDMSGIISGKIFQSFGWSHEKPLTRTEMKQTGSLAALGLEEASSHSFIQRYPSKQIWSLPLFMCLISIKSKNQRMEFL